ncbi:hypothetical protein GCM10018980_26650 [Streptomyces capoamus]|uniref:Uncharacterized protein n=1 Tax=Streptomyces capoamus TaxID=68183 RepID=A0A919C3A2_9ACTN|nr:hypothetical protein [Streptomyces capoamus]GGW19986.1 hypothetical protein GCM10010501_61420 [Streptomyces libani subsp. rufus]GHG47163.1 hypothetical protein GCM10018980_26650 [Streptomyces capoamus]
MADPDLGADSHILKKGAKDIVEALRPTEGFNLEESAGRSSSFGRSSASSSFVAFCATWQAGAQILSGSTAHRAAGLISASGTLTDTDGQVRDAAHSVKTDHGK